MRYYYRPGHPRASANGFVPADELGADETSDPVLAINAGIMAGRFYENVGAFTDGTPVNSRRDHREYLKQHNVTHMDDFKGVWAKAAKEREEHRLGGTQKDKAERREALANAVRRTR